MTRIPDFSSVAFTEPWTAAREHRQSLAHPGGHRGEAGLRPGGPARAPALSRSGQEKWSSISATTVRDKLPVAVSFSPGPISAACRRIRALRAMADNEISSGDRSVASSNGAIAGMGRAAQRREARLIQQHPGRHDIAEPRPDRRILQHPWGYHDIILAFGQKPATPSASTIAAGPRRFARRWRPPSSDRPARPAACRASRRCRAGSAAASGNAGSAAG